MVLGESGFHLDHYAMRWHKENDMRIAIGWILVLLGLGLIFLAWRKRSVTWLLIGTALVGSGMSFWAYICH